VVFEPMPPDSWAAGGGLISDKEWRWQFDIRDCVLIFAKKALFHLRQKAGGEKVPKEPFLIGKTGISFIY